MQALFSACAKMCVRELRKTETANVSVFYLSFCSTIGALCGILLPKFWGVEDTVRMPDGLEWLLLIGVGKPLLLSLPSRRVIKMPSSLRYCCHVKILVGTP